jgi:DNA-binding transcriptional MerR regulator
MAAAAVAEAEGLQGIAVLAEELGVTPRTIRFYEDKGLIAPQRAGSTRVYTRREQARMKLILRGKRLGFTLRQIKEFLDLYDVDSTHREQMRALVGAVHERIETLREQRRALEQTLDELIDIERQALARLSGE